MHRFRKILVPVGDEAASRPVIERAARLAKNSGASVKLLAVTEDPPWYARLVLPESDKLLALLVRDREATMESLASTLRKEGVETSIKTVSGRRRVEIVREVLRGEYDLVLKEAEPNENVLFGSTDMYLLRACPCPVWLLKPGHANKPFARVAAAVDPAPRADEADLLNLKPEVSPKDPKLDAKILQLAGSLAESEGAELHVVHAWSAPGEILLRGDSTLAAEVDKYVDDSKTEARKAFDRLLAEVPVDPSGRKTHLLKGDPADVLVDFVKQADVDLIVMGTVGRAGIPGILIGNSAETIFQRVGCSVLAVKPDGFASPVSPDPESESVAGAAGKP